MFFLIKKKKSMLYVEPCSMNKKVCEIKTAINEVGRGIKKILSE